ncbi:MAG: hypothetical protein V2A73_14255 [Pseudomonadota bacterium]
MKRPESRGRWGLRLRFGLLVAFSFLGCLGDDDDSVSCPEGWSHDGTLCAPSEDYLEQVRQEIGSGAFGFARAVEGNCAPKVSACSFAGMKECTDWLVSGLAIAAYRDRDIRDELDGTNPPCFSKLETTAEPVASAHTDSQGRFTMSLPTGETYTLLAMDPLDGCPQTLGTGVLEEGALRKIVFVFDHGAD